MGKFYFAFAWDIIVNLHVCICKNKICIWSDPGVNLPICKYTPVCICVRMRHLLTPSKICTPGYIYTCVFLAHANWTLDQMAISNLLSVMRLGNENVNTYKLKLTCRMSRSINSNSPKKIMLIGQAILSQYNLI